MGRAQTAPKLHANSVAAAMHRPFFVDRIPDSLRSPQPKVHLAECPMCRDTVPADQLTRFIGRTMCRNCAAMWFEEDEAENDGKADS